MKSLLDGNREAAEKLWGPLATSQYEILADLTRRFGFAVAKGELKLLSGSWYVTNSGLLGIARRRRCTGILVQHVAKFCIPERNCWVVKAVVYPVANCRGFVGYGDANPLNIARELRGAELRIAETRAVNLALRKAYGIGLCSAEEIGDSKPYSSQKITFHTVPQNGHELRDRLLLLIWKYQLDAAQVKRYAAHFCDCAELQQASRERVHAFVEHLDEVATKGREQLVEQLAPYAETQQANSTRESEAA